MSMMISDLIGSVAPEASSEIVLDDSWMQGRTCYGGLAAALAYQTAANQLETPTPLRSLLATFVGPLGVGQVDLNATVLRTGKSVTQIEAKASQNGQVATSVTAIFGADRPTIGIEPPTAGERADRDSIQPMPFFPGMMPSFLQHFDARWIVGMPTTSYQSRIAQAWVRLKDDGIKAFPAAHLIAIADMPPPIMMLHYKDRVKSSSLSWSLEFVKDPATVSGDWFYLDFALEAAANGYSQQSGKIYDEGGDLICLGRQCMVYFE